MTLVEKTQIYVPDALVREARARGMQNFSEFVREKLKEFIRQNGGAA